MIPGTLIQPKTYTSAPLPSFPFFFLPFPPSFTFPFLPLPPSPSFPFPSLPCPQIQLEGLGERPRPQKHFGYILSLESCLVGTILVLFMLRNKYFKKQILPSPRRPENVPSEFLYALSVVHYGSRRPWMVECFKLSVVVTHVKRN